MRAVRDEEGRLVVHLDRTDGSVVVDPATGDERPATTASLDPAIGSLDDDIPAATRDLLAAVAARGLGLLLVLARGPQPIRTLLDRVDLCESDLHGLAADLRTAGLVESARINGSPGYGITEQASAGLEGLDAPEPRRR